MKNLDAIFGDELRGLGFFSAAAGALVGLVGSWIAATGMTPMQTGVYVGLVGVCGFISVWSFLSWIRAKRRRPPLLQAIKARKKEQPPA